MGISVKDYLTQKLAAQSSDSVDDDDDESAATGAEDGDTPYDKVSRASMPAPDLGRGPLAAQSGDYSDDPMMKRFQSDQSDSSDLLQAKSQIQGQNNIFTAVGGLANAGNSANTGQATAQAVQKGIADQNDGVSKALGDQVGAREKVIEAIAKRQAMGAKAQSDYDLKNKGLGIKQNAQDELAGYHKGLVAAKNNMADALGGNRTQKQATTDIRAAASLYKDPNISKEVTKLNSARSAQTLIDEIRDGRLTDSSNVKSQLTNLLTQIELGSPGGQGDRHNMGVDTLYGRIQNAASFIEGHPNSTIPRAYLDQIESEAHALGDRAASNYKGLTDSALSGADLSGDDPDANPGRVMTLAKQRQQKFLKTAGYDPASGAPIGRAPIGSQTKPKTVMQNGHTYTLNPQTGEYE